MSAFYDLASLVVVPSGYKSGKIYAQKPLTTDGQLTFSRSTTATRVNSAGLIEEVASNVPRLDYLNSSCPRLLLEPQRTNSLTYSEQFDNAAWTKLNATISTNTTDTLDPSGYNGADKITDDTTNGAHIVYRLSTWDTTQRTASVYAKAGTASKISIQNASTGQGAFFDLSTGTITALSAPFTATITAVGNGWYRLTATHTAGSSQTFSIGLYEGTATYIYAGTGSYAYIWGAQLEAGSYATSYIPTLGAAVTRGADAASKTGISSLIGQTEGTLFVDGNYKQGNYSQLIFIHDTSITQFIGISLGEGVIYGEVYNAGYVHLFQYILSASETRFKLALAYKTNDFAFYVNGVQRGVATSGTTPTSFDDFYLGRNSATPTSFAQNHNQALLFKTRLTNAQLAELTSL